jgi:chemotaxis protein MotA
MSRQQEPKRSGGHLDLATLAGLVIAIAGIAGGLLLEGGKLSDVGQVTAALIVLGGTLGAVMVTTPLPLFLAAVKKLPSMFWYGEESDKSLTEQILRFAAQARKTGIVSLEEDLDNVADPFLRKALRLAVDGTDIENINRVMELEIHMAEQRGEALVKVYESAGGYAPTIGIIGAVLGLIQVMKHLENIEAVGHGIAVAFVATVYGVALANIFLLPAAHKLRQRLADSLCIKEMMLEGVLSIAGGMNPALIRDKLDAYLQPQLEEGDAETRKSGYARRTRTAAL